MKLYNVYKTYDIALTRGEGCYLWDKEGNKYLDFYGGHAAISIGHTHPHYVEAISQQLKKLAYYSNSVILPIQEKLARAIGERSGYDHYQLFLCSTGAEANENAIKLASFQTGKKRVLAFHQAFHGRTHGAVAVTDNPKIKAPVNDDSHVTFLPLNDSAALEKAFAEHDDIASVIIEPIQGVAGIFPAKQDFLRKIQELCKKHQAIMIADEIQSGCGRTGQYFAHFESGARPQLISMAKGIGNGFPIAALLIHPDFKPWYGQLGTTFGGNPLACAASIAVHEVLSKELLMANALKAGSYLIEALDRIEGIKEVRGRGLMIAIEMEHNVATLRQNLLNKHFIFTGNAAHPNVIRLLPPLTVEEKHLDHFVKSFKKALKEKWHE